jgi:hypothetical protein
MKLASLAHYLNLGDEQHRSIDDCLLTIEVLKMCSI